MEQYFSEIANCFASQTLPLTRLSGNTRGHFTIRTITQCIINYISQKKALPCNTFSMTCLASIVRELWMLCSADQIIAFFFPPNASMTNHLPSLLPAPPQAILLHSTSDPHCTPKPFPTLQLSGLDLTQQIYSYKPLRQQPNSLESKMMLDLSPHRTRHTAPLSQALLIILIHVHKSIRIQHTILRYLLQFASRQKAFQHVDL